MPSHIAALVFDFDGLILDTETPEAEAWEQEFARYNLAIPEGWWAGVTGRGPEEVLEWPEDLLARLLGRPIDSYEVLARVNVQRLAGIAAAQVRPGVLTLLDQCEALGIPHAIASSSKHVWIEKHLSTLGLRDRFPNITGREDAARAKPHPDLYLHCCETLGVRPQDALALEDSPNGIAAAKAAGMTCIAVPNPVTAGLDLSAADLLLTSLEELDLSEFR